VETPRGCDRILGTHSTGGGGGAQKPAKEEDTHTGSSWGGRVSARHAAHSNAPQRPASRGTHDDSISRFQQS